jgi:hypothetical protein
MNCEQIIGKWNESIDERNGYRWCDLDENERIEFAFKCGVESTKSDQERQMIILSNIIYGKE